MAFPTPYKRRRKPALSPRERMRKACEAARRSSAKYFDAGTSISIGDILEKVAGSRLTTSVSNEPYIPEGEAARYAAEQAAQQTTEQSEKREEYSYLHVELDSTNAFRLWIAHQPVKSDHPHEILVTSGLTRQEVDEVFYLWDKEAKRLDLKPYKEETVMCIPANDPGSSPAP